MYININLPIVMQSDAPAELLALCNYTHSIPTATFRSRNVPERLPVDTDPAVLLAGDIEFTSRKSAGEALSAALGSASKMPGGKLRKILMRPYHSHAMGHVALVELQQAFGCKKGNCSAVEVMDFSFAFSVESWTHDLYVYSDI